MLLTRKVKKNFKYRNLGGEMFHIEFEVSKDDCFNKAMTGNWACYNFMERRKDFKYDFPHKLYYGKINGLGYIMSEDELEV